MKPASKKPKLIRGTSSAVTLSAITHLAIFFIAGGLTIFQATKKEEKTFRPPPAIERPKKPLKQPQVKMKRNVNPGGVRRIVSKATQGVPDLQLPEMEGVGKGLGGDVGGFELMPDPGSISIFGGAKSLAVGNDLEGTFYSLAYDRRGKETGISDEAFEKTIYNFTKSGWNTRIFAPYYRSPNKLYTTQIVIPPTSSEFGPGFFGMPTGPDFEPIHWCVYYKGKISRPEGGRYRFWGFADDILLVRINGELVLNGSHTQLKDEFSDWVPDSDEDLKYPMGYALSSVGHWFELKANTPAQMEVLIGEVPGGNFAAMLAVEKEGEYYARTRDGAPVLPAFKTAEISQEVKDEILYMLVPGDLDLDSDLTFNVY